MPRVPPVRRRTLLTALVALVAIVCIAGLAAVPVIRSGQLNSRLPAPSATRGSGAPAHFTTLPPGASLPSGEQCAAWVKARPEPEDREVNRVANQTTGQHLASDFFPADDDPRANTQIAPRVDGQFTGTTYEILRWAACKWGVDEDLVAAQAAVESWWRQGQVGDWGTDAAACPTGHEVGVDGQGGRCPESYGILQNRYPVERSAFPGAERSTAMNADTAYATWRACYEGYEHWLNGVDRGRQYRAGDAWGCVGRWYAGRWYTAAATTYISKVQAYRDQRIWRQPAFQQA